MICPDDPSIIDKLHYLYSEMTARFGDCTGVSPSRYRLLQQLYYNEEISQTALQKELQIDSAAVTRHLKQLEAENAVIRRTNPSDNRVTLVRLTESGRQNIAAYREEKTKFLERLLRGISPEEQQQLNRLIEQMQANICESKGDSNP